MTNILQLAAFFLAQIAFGSALILPFFPARVIGRTWLQFYYGFISFFLILFFACLYRLNTFSYNYISILALALWILAMSFTKQATKSETILHWFFAACSLVLMFVIPQRQFFYHNSIVEYLPNFGLIVLGTVFLSFHLMNMIFGHWYLVNRELPIKHLITTCRNLTIVTYLRMFSVAYATYVAYSAMNTSAFARLIDFMGHGVFFWARILAGLGIPWLVVHLAYSSAKIGSNQSATGILYAGTVFVLMGEIMGLYLFSITGVFF